MNAASPKRRRSYMELLSEPLLPLRHYIGTKLYRRRYRNVRLVCSSDAVVSGFGDQLASLKRLFNRDNMRLFLKRLAELTSLSGPFTGSGLFLPELDEIARNASLAFGLPAGAAKGSGVLVYIATEVYATGGHTRVIEDIASALPEYRHVLILTRMGASHPQVVSLTPRFGELSLEVHPLQTSNLAQRVGELASLIETLSPEAVLLLTHPDDAVANVAVSGRAAPRVLFFHHSDHQPALGAFRTDYAHVDLTPACHSVCSAHPELRASLLNLCAADSSAVKTIDRDSIIGATCGSPHKYAGSSEYSYAQLLAALFSGGVVQIVHIGEMPSAQKDEIRAEIAARGQDPGRVDFLPDTPSLPAKLKEISPDFYLTSHPIGGGKTTIEALSVGLPILWVCPASTPPLLNCDLAFGVSVPLASLEQAPASVHRLKAEKERLAKCSRAVYEQHYSPLAFRSGLLRAIGIDL